MWWGLAWTWLETPSLSLKESSDSMFVEGCHAYNIAKKAQAKGVHVYVQGGITQESVLRNMYVCGWGRFNLRVGLHYGQTSRGEMFGPMKMQKCPKSVLSAFTLEAEVQRTSPPKEPRWQHFQEVMAPRVRPLEPSLGRAKYSTQTSVERPNLFYETYVQNYIQSVAFTHHF